MMGLDTRADQYRTAPAYDHTHWRKITRMQVDESTPAFVALLLYSPSFAIGRAPAKKASPSKAKVLAK